MAADPFDDLLSLEDQFYDQGYREGMEDGTKAGRIEGRSFGLEKGYEKFMEAGRLHSKAIVWANRLPRKQESRGTQPEAEAQPSRQLPLLSSNARLDRNIQTVCELLEPDTLSTENSDEAVEDFDDRLKRAQGRVKMIQRAVGEGNEAEEPPEANLKEATIEDVRIPSRVE